jgi:uncharacterized repeat protein (TIGR01451 family)
MKNILLLLFIYVTSAVSAQVAASDDCKNQLKNQASAVFEENKGQMKDQNWNPRPDVLYSGNSEGMNFYIRNSGMSYQLTRIDSWKDEDRKLDIADSAPKDKLQVPDQFSTYRVDAEWINANQNFNIIQGESLQGYNNYYNVPEGIEPALFVKKFETITLKNVWEGIDLHYYGTDGFLETDYLVAPGADYRKIKIQFKGAELLTDKKGNLIIKTPFGEIHEGALKVYQNNERIEAYWKISEDNVVSFEIPNYNADLALRIDPLTRVWGTYYGGSGSDDFQGLSLDSNGFIYLSGYTTSLTQIATTGAHQTIHVPGASLTDALLVKFNNSGTRIWGTYYGGNSDESCSNVAASTNGDVYILGRVHNTTTSSSAIATTGAHQTTFGGISDVFLAKFNSDGIRLWGTYYGGTGGEGEQGLHLDAAGNVYIGGTTASTSAISTAGAYQSVHSGGGFDVFVVKFNSSGVRLWGTYYGGNGDDYSKSITTDPTGNIYILGDTESTDAIASAGAFQTTYGGGTQEDLFLLKLNSLGNRIWGTYYGGSGYDKPANLVLDQSGNIYISGTTNSATSIATVGIHQSVIGGSTDAFLAKFNSFGIRQWGTYTGGPQGDVGNDLAIDTDGNTYLSGITSSSSAITTSDTHQPEFGGGQDVFLAKFNSSGARQWGTYYGGNGTEYTRGGLFIDAHFRIYMCGISASVSNISTSNSYQSSFSGGSNAYDSFLVKFKQSKINGFVWNDWNANCLKETSETNLLSGVNLMIQPSNYVTQSVNGFWSIDSLPAGTYTITIDTTNLNWISTCPITQSFTVTNPNGFTDGPNFGLISTNPCSDPDVSIYAPFLRPCLPNQMIYVSACNQTTASGALNDSYVDVELDPLMAITSSSLSYTPQGNNMYRFQTGTLNPGQCVNFNIATTISSPTVSCAGLLGLTLCMDANLYPVQSCALDTIPSDPIVENGTGGTLNGFPQPCSLPWDQSSLSVDGWCQGDSVYFSITNTGDPGGGDMECYSPMWVTVDGVVTYTDSIMIPGGQTVILSYFGNGQSWILNAEQHPLHPGNSHPNAHVEACGDTANWTPDIVNDFPQDDADPVVDIYCGVVTGSYDPNDKTGFPIGQSDQFYIQPNQQLQYAIRFQNTGTDTAFTVVIRDTLDTDLNIFTVTPGVSSHLYEFRMYGPRVLEWTFNNINLPDSSTNQTGSNGFVTFHVEQVPNLSPATEIINDADIYFDFNDPITTNTTIHRIFEGFVSVTSLEEMSKQVSGIKVYPNPSNGQMTILIEESIVNNIYNFFDQQGRIVKTGFLNGIKNTIDSDLKNGMYYLMIGENVVKVQIIE